MPDQSRIERYLKLFANFFIILFALTIGYLYFEFIDIQNQPISFEECFQIKENAVNKRDNFILCFTQQGRTFSKATLTPTPKATPPTEEISQSQLYRDDTIAFLHPWDWTPEPPTTLDTKSYITFMSGTYPIFTLTYNSNTNPQTGSPYSSLDQFLDSRSALAQDKNLASMNAKYFYLSPEDNVIASEQYFAYTPDEASIIQLHYQGQELDGSTPSPILDQLVSTLLFIPPNCSTCTELTPPSPDFCHNGVLSQPSLNQCGCLLPPQCIKQETTLF